MKRLSLFCLLFSISVVYSFGDVKYITLKKGDTHTINQFWAGGDNYGNYDLTFITGYAVAVEFQRSDKVIVHAIAKGKATLQNYWNSGGNPTVYVFDVVDVSDIKLASNIELAIGETFTYSPIVTDAEATPTLTWTSSNTSVATVSADGEVSAKGTGQTVITCTASNGVSALSVLKVNPVLASRVELNVNEYQINCGESVLLTSTVLPANVTSSNVNYLSTNDNIAQVDENGKVTAISPGYCSIYAKADDGSGKFAKCLIHVKGTAASRGDVNGDGEVTVTDAEAVIDMILSNP